MLDTASIFAMIGIVLAGLIVIGNSHRVAQNRHRAKLAETEETEERKVEGRRIVMN